VVKQTVRETYTYYTPDTPEGHAVEDSPLKGRGKAWVRGSYRHPVYPSPLDVRVGDAGIKAWMVLNWLKECNENMDELLKRYGHVLTSEDVAAARWYYEQNSDLIERELSEEARRA